MAVADPLDWGTCMEGTIREKEVELERLKIEGFDLSQELQASKKELVSVRQDVRRISQHISKLRNEIRRLKNRSSGSNLRRRGRAPTFKLARLAYSDLVEALTMFRWAVLDRRLSASVSEKELKSMCQKIKRATACLKI